MKLDEHLAECDSDLRRLIIAIGNTCKTIKKGFASRQSCSDTENVYGEKQMALDKWADEVLIADLKASGLVKYLASEEQPEILEFDSAGNFGVTMDPLDGSSLIGVNLAVGTIIGIYRGNVLAPGNTMVGAMYVLYGPLTTLTYTVKKGVHEFVLDTSGNFILQEENIRIPDGKIFAPGALRKEYLPGHLKWIEALESEGYKIRFSGSFVADVHQILHKGGVFTYPGYRGKEKGKLRLLFEANPMGFVVAQAGGATSHGTGDILTVMPESVNQRIPIYIGGKREIQLIEKINKEA
ncbi:MAG: fructose-1,6-bisphosphatase [Candidatus Thermoplasmatota archaeon]|nr:fructose-1,6-bisphosphatase [Euryarchaeota archaeon]MBU4031616.1 fructose-1,6-bisphosphatase [Candidatus Thermoplasmatota archaeon]MBU4072401.1 fructose-1,6-bisphosphatase [Candidatus Thermoplasmatota archaeon]MBU4144936.1 fructose-1,6-bisphosphatase [Candidatus Thermoplasmatota archaeon]MBU4591691.1 fructose-1,6-bisphosphatase [Candidatus Thermoplasmatota archaeon]